MMKRHSFLTSISLLALVISLAGFSGCGSSSQKNTTEKKPAEQITQQTARPSTEPSTKLKLPAFKAQLDERARAIMTAAAETYGGLTHPLEIHDLTMKIVAFYGEPLDLVDMTFQFKKPDKFKIVMSYTKAGQQVVIGSDAKMGWVQIFKGTQLVETRDLLPSSDQLEQFRSQFDDAKSGAFDSYLEALLQAYRTFKYVETIPLETGPADVIEVSSPDGKIGLCQVVFCKLDSKIGSGLGRNQLLRLQLRPLC
ncbi:hypothetical protein HYR54_05485 [Candidatus Acetothermia bacterium]|nr:hypothetical protein [Candidatus Acetothermia bacterium]